MNETQKNNIKNYKNGLVMYNESGTGRATLAFKFFGRQYISSKVKRSKKYSFDSREWKPLKANILEKVKAIINKDVKVANDCKKSKLVGV